MNQTQTVSIQQIDVRQRAIVAVLTVGGAAAVFNRWIDTPFLGAGLAAAVLVLGVLTDIDLRTFRLPNRIVGPFALLSIVGVTIGALVEPDWRRAMFAVVVALGWSAALLGLNMLGQAGMGDVKLAVPIGLIAGWLGATAVFVSVFASAISSGVYGILLLVINRNDPEAETALAYGPFLALGSVAGMLLA